MAWPQFKICQARYPPSKNHRSQERSGRLPSVWGILPVHFTSDFCAHPEPQHQAPDSAPNHQLRGGGGGRRYSQALSSGYGSKLNHQDVDRGLDRPCFHFPGVASSNMDDLTCRSNPGGLIVAHTLVPAPEITTLRHGSSPQNLGATTFLFSNFEGSGRVCPTKM